MNQGFSDDLGYGRPLQTGLVQSQQNMGLGARPSEYSDRFSTSLSADATLYKNGPLSNGNTTIFTVPETKVYIVSNIWVYYTGPAIASSGGTKVEFGHVFTGESPASRYYYWGTNLDELNFWAICQVHKVFEAGSSLFVMVDAAGANQINVNIDGIRVETQ